MVFECRGGGGEVGGGVYISQLHNIIMSTPLRGGGPHIVLLRLASALASALVTLVLASALASSLSLRHPLLDFYLGAPKYYPYYYIEIIFHW